MTYAVISLAVLFFLGHALRWFFVRTKVPDLLVLVIIGYVVGPVLHLIEPQDWGAVGAVLSTLALVVILYEGGLHLSARDLKDSTLPAGALSLLGFTLIALTGTLAAWSLGQQSWPVSLLLGLAIGSTSSAIVIPMVKPLSVQPRTKTILSLESAFTDVLAIVIFLVIVDAIATQTFSVQELLLGIGPKTGISVLFGIGLGLGWAFFRKNFKDLTNMAFASEAWALLSYGLIELSGHNGAMGVLALGFTLANLNLLPEWAKPAFNSEPVSMGEMSLLAEITFLLKTFFFIYLGTLIQLNQIETVLFAGFICALVFLTRYLSVRLLFSKSTFGRLDAMVTTSMGPRGLACAVLATVPLQRGIEGGEWIQNSLFAIIPLSILLTAVFVAASEIPWVRKKLGGVFKAYPEQSSVTSPDDAIANTQTDILENPPQSGP